TLAEEMIRDLSLELGATGDRRHQGRLHFELARLYEHPLRLLEQADREYRAALALRPEHLPTVRGARRVMLARGALRDALPLYEAEVLLVSDPSHKAALYYERGRLLEDHLGRVEEARAAYAQALELSPGDAALLSALDQRYTATQGWSRLDPILEEAANAVCADPHHRAAIVMRRARIAEWRLGQVDRAIELYEMALRIDPTANLAVRELQRLHRNQHRWRDLIRVLEFEGARLTDPAGKSLALAEAARIHSEQLGNRREAIAVMERALEHDPDNSEVLSGLSRLYEQTSQHALLAAMLERLAARTKDSRARAALFHRLGALHEERLGQDEQAVQWYDRALEIDPTSIPTLRALGSLHTRRSAWEPLVRILLAEASHAGDPERRATAHCRVANVLELRLEKTEDAIEQHLRALTSAPLHPPSFKALSRLLSAAGRWRQLVELHQRAVELAPDPTTAIAHLFKVGMIYEDWLDEPTQASHAFRRILELDPRHLGAVHALQRATERAGRYRELVLALELEAELLEDPARIVSLLHRAGEILLDELSDREGAVERFGRVLALDSSHRPALASLGRLHHAAGRWHELLEVYEQELALSESEDDSVLLLTKMGDLCRERLGREDDAIRHLRRAVSLDPTFVPAVESLTRLLLLREDFSELARVLELRLEALSDPDALSSTALRLGTLREDRLDDLRGAIAAYEQALRAQPESRAAIRALSRARARSGDFPELVRDLEREAKASLDPRMQNSIRMQAALLHSHRLDAPRVAISGLEAVIEEAPRQLTALLDLELLHRKGKSWEALVAVLQRLASVQADPVAKVATLRELIRIQSAHRVGTLEEQSRPTSP
ncbi:MAG: tetratricopeptide repeat protein, partial [Myxococcales bacterium]|nr:tetratricopeptide repeat protein [Myxococcales bacterium]